MKQHYDKTAESNLSSLQEMMVREIKQRDNKEYSAHFHTRGLVMGKLQDIETLMVL